MTISSMRLVLVSTPLGYLGSGRGGGVELTVVSLTKGLLDLGHEVTLVAPEGSVLPDCCSKAVIKHVSGMDQPSWQHQKTNAPVLIPTEAVLPSLWDMALELGKSADAVLNFSYDWLPIWLTTKVEAQLFHLISMGGVSQAMQAVIKDLSEKDHSRLAFHTFRQASDYKLFGKPLIVGNGFNLQNYELQLKQGGPLGWAGRIAPEKGLEDAVAVASELGDTLLIWGLTEDLSYVAELEASVPSGTISWRGFLPTSEFQKQLGKCRALLNTPKWNEAYGNVVVEAMACGVPVIAYDRGGPGELVKNGVTGWLVPPDDVFAMTNATSKADQIDRSNCRKWVEISASHDGFADRVVNWIKAGLHSRDA